MDADTANNKVAKVNGKEPFTLLLDAIRQKDICRAETLIKQCSKFQEYSHLPMHLAICNDDLKMVEMLIKHGAEINVTVCNRDHEIHKLSGCLLSLAVGKSLKMVKLLLKYGADINGSPYILGNALIVNNNKMLCFLLKAGADFSLQPAPGEDSDYSCGFPLCRAAANGNMEGLKILINHIRKKPKEERTIMLSQALASAAIWWHLDAVSLLLKEGADPNYANRSGSTLRRTINVLESNDMRKTKVEITKLLLAHGASFSEDEKANNIDASTWLDAATMAVCALDFEAFKFFYEQGNIEVGQLTLLGESALVYAVKASAFEMAQFLLEQGANPHAKCAKGLPVIIHAINQKDSRILKKLFKHGVDFKEAYEFDNQILFKLIDNNRIDILELLTKHWPEFYKQHYALNEVRSVSSELRGYAKDRKFTLMDIGGLKPVLSLPPLLYAIDKGKIDVAKFLLETGADPNMQAESGMIGLIECIKAQYIEGIRLLLKYKADVNIKDDSGNTPLIWAVFMGLENVVIALLQADADIYACNKDGQNPVSLCQQMETSTIGKLLTEWGWYTSSDTFCNHPIALNNDKPLRDSGAMPFPHNLSIEKLEEQADKDI